MTIRIGQGIDVHAFAEPSAAKIEPSAADTKPSPGETQQPTITLGGVEIPHDKILLAHSDGDVLIHALCDALLGALAMGDIGQHFPDSDEQYANIDSRTLLAQVMAAVADKNYKLINADLTIVAQQPKMAPYIVPMRNNIARDTSVSPDAISVKATTSEHLGFTGRGEGIACFAIVLLQELSD